MMMQRFKVLVNVNHDEYMAELEIECDGFKEVKFDPTVDDKVLYIGQSKLTFKESIECVVRIS